MALNPVVIKYPISFWMTFCIAIVTALLAVAWHGVLFVIAVLTVCAILALPTISRYEMLHGERVQDASAAEKDVLP